MHLNTLNYLLISYINQCYVQDYYFEGTLERLASCSISTLPSEKSVKNYFAEFTIIDEPLHNNPNVNLGRNASSVKDKHLNEVNFSIETPEEHVQYLETIDRVPGACAVDCTTQILCALVK